MVLGLLLCGAENRHYVLWFFTTAKYAKVWF